MGRICEPVNTPPLSVVCIQPEVVHVSRELLPLSVEEGEAVNDVTAQVPGPTYVVAVVSPVLVKRVCADAFDATPVVSSTSPRKAALKAIESELFILILYHL